jgi:hypothetical protein
MSPCGRRLPSQVCHGIVKWSVDYLILTVPLSQLHHHIALVLILFLQSHPKRR